MASRTTKIAIGVLALVALGLGAAGAANADDEDDDDGEDPPTDDPPEPPSDEPPDVVFPPPPNTCDYSGCGEPFDTANGSPTLHCIRVQQLGYPIDCAAVAAAPGNFALNPQRQWVWEFQDGYNKVRKSAGIAGPVAIAGQAAVAALGAIKGSNPLVRDGLHGKNTITAVGRATALQNLTGIPWRNLVALAQV